MSVHHIHSICKSLYIRDLLLKRQKSGDVNSTENEKWEDLTFLTLLNRGWKQKKPIVDGKKIVISDSTKKKKPQRISPWHIFTLPQPAPVVLGLFSKRREC